MQYTIDRERTERKGVYMSVCIQCSGASRCREIKERHRAIKVSWAKERTESITSLAWHIEDSSTVLCVHRGHSFNYTFTDTTRAHACMHTHTSINSSPPFPPR